MSLVEEWPADCLTHWDKPVDDYCKLMSICPVITLKLHGGHMLLHKRRTDAQMISLICVLD